MSRTKITKTTLTVLALFFTASIGNAQQKHSTSYKISGEPTLYTTDPDRDPGNATILIPESGASSPTSKPPEPTSYFHLEFVLKTIDSGKVSSSRTYSMDGNTSRDYHASYRSDTAGGFPGSNSRNQNRTNIDCNDAHLVGTDSLSLVISASMYIDAHPAPPTEPETVTYAGSFYTLTAFGKPTIVFAADTQTPNRKIQMEVTATPIRTSTPPKP